jgi:Leucine-rich repeat (LRR) protein
MHLHQKRLDANLDELVKKAREPFNGADPTYARKPWTLTWVPVSYGHSGGGLLSGNHLGQLSQEALRPLAEAIGSNESIGKLDLTDNMLGKLSLEAWQLLAEAIRKNESITTLCLDDNKLCDLPVGTMQVLAEAIDSNKNITKLNVDTRELDELRRKDARGATLVLAIERRLGDKFVKQTREADGELQLGRQDLGKIPVGAMRPLAASIGSNHSITKLSLGHNQLGELPVEAMRLLAEAIDSNKNIVDLELDIRELSELCNTTATSTQKEVVGARRCAALLSALAQRQTDRLVQRAREADGELSLQNANLDSLSPEALQLLFDAVGTNRNISKLRLWQNNLGQMPVQAMQVLANAIGSSQSILTLLLDVNKLGELPVEVMRPLAAAIGSNESITTLALAGNNLGDLSEGAMRLLAEAIGSSKTIAELGFNSDDLRKQLGPEIMNKLDNKKHTHAAAVMLSAVKLRRFEMNDTTRRALEGVPGLGPFAHEVAAWQPGVVLTPRAHARALFDGMWPLSPRVLVWRLFWVGTCAGAFALPRAYAKPGASAAPATASAGVSLAFTFGVLERHCDTVPADLRHAYIDATSGFVVVLMLAALLVLKGALFAWLGSVADCVDPDRPHKGDAVLIVDGEGEGSHATVIRDDHGSDPYKLEGASCGSGWYKEAQVTLFVPTEEASSRGAKCRRKAKALAARLIRAFIFRAKHRAEKKTDELASSEDDATKRAVASALEQQKDEMAARDAAFHFLVQVLCGCNSLGAYFAAAPTGLLCTCAHVGLAVFYKPLAFPLWYCLLVLLDSSATKLRHTLMTQQLCHVVQTLFTTWAIACGMLSLPLLVVFPMFGLMLAAPFLLFMRLKNGELKLVWNRNGRFEKDAWNELSGARHAELFGTEQLLYRLRGYSVFAALVFGIRLWEFYETGDWVGTLSDAGSALGASTPVWDLPTLALSLRWPTELSLPDQLPLFVSAGFVGFEALLKAWRWGSKRVGFSTRDEFLRRLHGDDYCLQPLRRRRPRAADLFVGQDAKTLEILINHRQI